MGEIIPFKKKENKKERTPLYSSHLQERGRTEDDFGSRMERIKNSLEKINEMMRKDNGGKNE